MLPTNRPLTKEEIAQFQKEWNDMWAKMTPAERKKNGDIIGNANAPSTDSVKPKTVVKQTKKKK